VSKKKKSKTLSADLPEVAKDAAGVPADAAGVPADAVGVPADAAAEEILDNASVMDAGVLTPLRELMSPRAFFRRTLKMDRFSVLAADNKYKLEVLTEIYRRRDAAFRYACFFCLGMMAYCMVIGMLSFNMLLVNKTVYFSQTVPIVDFYTLAPIALVFIPALFSDFMKQGGVLIAIIVFIIFTALYILKSYYVFIPFTVAGAVIYLRQNAVLDIYAVLENEDGFPQFSDFSFEHKHTEQKPVEDQN
jgi:hypothetical protein